MKVLACWFPEIVQLSKTAQLANLVDGSFKVSDPLRWDGLDTLKFLAAFSSSLVAASTSLVVT